VPIACAVNVHEWDDASGSMYADICTTISATLIRRPHSDTPWPEPASTNYALSWRWNDQLWDWFLASETPLTEPDLAEIKAQLAAST
jgi:hypothetical protein